MTRQGREAVEQSRAITAVTTISRVTCSEVSVGLPSNEGVTEKLKMSLSSLVWEGSMLLGTHHSSMIFSLSNRGQVQATFVAWS